MNKRQSTSGRILLYDVSHTFVTSKVYRGVTNSQKIIADWVRFYRLENRMYYLHIIPDIKEEQ